MDNQVRTIELDKTKPVYLGIDVHKTKWSLSVVHSDQVIGRFTIEAQIALLEKLLKRYKGMEIQSVYEAGFSGFHLHHALTQMGVKNRITAVNKMPIISGNRVKTDKRDSLKLATFLSKGLLKANHIPTKELQDCRYLLRTREQLVRKKRRVIQQLKMTMHLEGIAVPESAGISKRLEKQLKELACPRYLKMRLETLLTEHTFIKGEIKKYDKEYRSGPEDSEQRKRFDLLMSVPGIGSLTATALLYEIGDWKRFHNEKEIAAFMGVTPREYSTGEHIHRGRITGQGNPWLRSLLIEAAWKAIRKDPSLAAFYGRLKDQKGSKRAIVAVGRKLICRIYAVVKQGVPYRMETEQKTQPNANPQRIYKLKRLDNN